MSYCDDCVHFTVCKYVKDLRKYEEKPAVYGGDVSEGPIVKYQIECPMKQTAQFGGSLLGAFHTSA